uniref:Uncharacterized protein n=1 Tax=Marseillevirus LCMAC102 TaxID=2506603 RepID=A0A481YUB7_9VIRU|nr:MAG: hypothetical protein LCMAC102_01600 [Marseillevirus LCMAC102]
MSIFGHQSTFANLLYPNKLFSGYILQNRKENTPGISSIIPPNSSVKQLSKAKYLGIVQNKRREFVHKHFAGVLSKLFMLLEEDAKNIKPCHREATFETPDHFDVDKTEILLREYFKDIGFSVIAEPRKDDITDIVLTLT